MQEKLFICPECGSTHCANVMEVFSIFDPNNPRSGILQWMHCAECERSIPSHLAQLWNGISVQEARAEWRVHFRDAK